MAGKITNAGLDYMDTNDMQADSTSWIVRLYSNNYTPVAGSVAANFTECTFPGYAAQTGLTWTFNAGAASVKTIVSQLMNFISTAGGGETIYGYYVQMSTTVLFAEKFAAGPYTISAAGNGVQLTITQTDTST